MSQPTPQRKTCLIRPRLSSRSVIQAAAGAAFRRCSFSRSSRTPCMARTSTLTIFARLRSSFGRPCESTHVGMAPPSTPCIACHCGSVTRPPSVEPSPIHPRRTSPVPALGQLPPHGPTPRAATGPRLTTTNTVLQGSGILDLVIYLVLESAGCSRPACENIENFEYENGGKMSRFGANPGIPPASLGKSCVETTFSVPVTGLPQRQSYPGAGTSANLERTPALTHLSSPPLVRLETSPT